MRGILSFVILTVICISCGSNPKDGSYRISGSFSINTQAIQDVTVTLESDRTGETQVVSASDGTFAFDDIWSGDYVLTAKKPGYVFNPQKITVHVENHDVVIDPFIIAVTWGKSYGSTGDEQGASVVSTSDGGYIIAGSIEETGQSYNGFLLRLDYMGNVLWKKTYGGTGYDFFSSVAIGDDGHFIAVGGTESISNGKSDIWIVEVDDNPDTNGIRGQALHSYHFGGLADEYANTIIRCSDNNFIIAGVACGSSSNWSSQGSLSGFYVSKLSSSDLSSILWDNCYGNSATWEKAFSVCELYDASGSPDGFAVCGATENAIGNTNIWLIKIDSGGSSSPLWSASVSLSADDEAMAVTQLQDKSIAVAGYTLGSDGTPDIWVGRYSSTGSRLFSRVLGGSSGDKAFGIIPDTDGFIIGGYSCVTSLGRGDSDFFVAKCDLKCETVWQHTYDRGDMTFDYGTSLSRGPDGGVIVAGYSMTGTTHRDAWVLKLDSFGERGE